MAKYDNDQLLRLDYRKQVSFKFLTLHTSILHIQVFINYNLSNNVKNDILNLLIVIIVAVDSPKSV